MPVVLVALVLVAVATVGGLLALVGPRWVRRRTLATRDTVTGGLARLHARIDDPRLAWTVWVGGWLVGLIAVTSALGALLRWLGGGDSTGLDRLLLDYFHRGRTPLLSTLWNTVTDVGASAFLVPVGVVGGLLWRWRRGDWFVLSVLGGSYLGASVLFNTTKRIVARARPAADIAFNPETGLAFPSGHTTDAAAFYTALGLLALAAVSVWAARVAVGTATAAVVLLVATSRLYLGAHWLTDVVVGAALGSVWAGLLWLTLTGPSGPYDRYVRHDPVPRHGPGR